MRKFLKRGMALGLSLMLGATGSLGVVNLPDSGTVAVKAAVEKSGRKAIADGIDILDYDSNVSATEFVVNNIAGFEKIAELVNSGKENFAGKKIMLNANLKYDKSVKNNHQVIGDSSHRFGGVFDGGFHTISGINLDSNIEHMGLFGELSPDAKLSKIILEDSSIVSRGSISLYTEYYVGGIASGPCSGTIDTCICGKSVEITGGQYTGGIIGKTSYNISKCINLSTVRGGYMSGGIVGSADSINNIRACINYGNVYGENKMGGVAVGGICGECGVSFRGEIIECCNMGTIAASEGIINMIPKGIGGITGAHGKTVNCYNGGQVIGIDHLPAGGIIGSSNVGPKRIMQNNYSVGKVKNGYPGAITSVSGDCVWELSYCYWLTGTAADGVCETGRGDLNTPPQDTSSVFEYNRSQMTAQAFVDELNANSQSLGYGKVWAMDTENRNNGYPVLKNVPYTIEELTGNSNIPDEEELPDTTPVSHFYEDHNYNTPATNSTIRIYANGKTVTVPGTTEKNNYKQCILYTDILPSYIYTVGKNGAIKPSSGKVVVGITASNQKPELVKGKIVDKSTSKIAAASIKSGQITVTAKSQPGKVYLWAIDTGRTSVAACIPVTVKAAPTVTNIYAISDTDSSFVYGKIKQFKSGKVGIGETVKVYLYPAYKQNNAVQKAKNVKYTAAVAANAADYFSVTQSGSNPYCFEISAKGLKDGKSVTGTITFTCNLNGKKAVFKATAINPVTNISTINENGLNKKADNSFSIKVSNTAKTRGTFELKPVCASNTNATTDKLKIYAMGSENGYDAAKLKEGKIKITAKKSRAQGKISMKAAADKKTVTVTAAKGAKPVTAYFLVVYNTVNDGAKNGYTVISVTAE